MANQYTAEEVLAVLRRLTRIEITCYSEGLPELLPLIIDVKNYLEKMELNERQRQVLELYFFQEYTQEETAQIINTSQVTVSHIINSIKKQLRRVVRDV